MKQNKIARRLILYFFLALLLFALVMGTAFTLLSARQTMALHRQSLETRAQTVADTMYGFLSGTNQTMNGMRMSDMRMSDMRSGGSGHHGGESNTLHGSGAGAYMRYLTDLVMADVWVVDSQSKTITPCSDHLMGTIEYGELPSGGEEIIDKALAGETAFGESLSDIWGEPTLSVGVPIRKDENSAPLGAVLLHTPVRGISSAIWDSIKTMAFSLLAALLLSVPMGILLSLKFTRPLNKMKNTAAQLAEGNLAAKNHIFQKDEIGELANAMDQMAAKLQEASLERERLEQTRRDFLSNISHELRTPVTVLRGSLEALHDGVITDPQQVREYQSQMLEESKYLQRLVNDLLELSRLENTDFQIEMAPLELRSLVGDAARAMRRAAEQRKVYLELDAPEREFTQMGDYGRLRQMLLTVLDNALKFSPPGETVCLTLRDSCGRTEISITDHGPGIPPEQLPHIFQRFQGSRGPDNPTGTGLGLPIAEQIASRHGVEIQVNSRPGHTEFVFLFPPAPTENR